MRTAFRYSLLTAIAGIGLLAAACRGDGSVPAATPTVPVPLPQPTPGATALSSEISALILPLTPDPQDVPPALGQLGPPETFLPEDLYSVMQGADPEPTAEEIASWKFLGGASNSYISLQTPPDRGPEFLVTTIFLHADEDGARAYFESSMRFPSQDSVRILEAQVGREVNQFSEFTKPDVGTETRIIAFGSHPFDQETPQYQSYYVYSRRGRVVVVAFGRAVRGEIGLDDLVELTRNVDARVAAAGL